MKDKDTKLLEEAYGNMSKKLIVMEVSMDDWHYDMFGVFSSEQEAIDAFNNKYPGNKDEDGDSMTYTTKEVVLNKPYQY